MQTTKPASGADRRARTEADKLKAAGLNASRMNLTLLEPEALTLITDPAHPLYDERVNIPVDPTDPLYRDIEARGVEKPVDVRKNGEDESGRPILQVIDGRQRVQILRAINAERRLGTQRRKLPVNFVTGDDRVMVLRGLSANLLRHDETVLTKAVKAQKAMSLGCGLDEIALACNLRTTKPIEDWLLVLNFIPEVKQAFNGELPASAIKTFAKVPREKQLEVLTKVREGGAKSGRQVRAAVEAARTGQEYVAPEGRKAMTPTRMEKLLVTLGTALVEAKAKATELVSELEAADVESGADEVLASSIASAGSRVERLEGAVALLRVVLGLDANVASLLDEQPAAPEKAA